METKSNKTQSDKYVYVVICYGNIVGIYESQEDAAQVQREWIQKNKPADLVCRAVISFNKYF